jgi:hypothetical protein
MTAWSSAARVVGEVALFSKTQDACFRAHLRKLSGAKRGIGLSVANPSPFCTKCLIPGAWLKKLTIRGAADASLAHWSINPNA